MYTVAVVAERWHGLKHVTVTEALVLRPLLEDRGHITESIRILVPVERMKQNRFQITTKRVRRSQQFRLKHVHARRMILLFSSILTLNSPSNSLRVCGLF